jgi:hypothetical protein
VLSQLAIVWFNSPAFAIISFGDNSAICHVAGRIPFAFLEDIHGKFVKTYGRAALTALPYAMNEEFSRVLSKQMDYFSNDPNADSINRMKGEMEQVFCLVLSLLWVI